MKAIGRTRCTLVHFGAVAEPSSCNLRACQLADGCWISAPAATPIPNRRCAERPTPAPARRGCSAPWRAPSRRPPRARRPRPRLRARARHCATCASTAPGPRRRRRRRVRPRGRGRSSRPPRRAPLEPSRAGRQFFLAKILSDEVCVSRSMTKKRGDARLPPWHCERTHRRNFSWHCGSRTRRPGRACAAMRRVWIYAAPSPLPPRSLGTPQCPGVFGVSERETHTT